MYWEIAFLAFSLTMSLPIKTYDWGMMITDAYSLEESSLILINLFDFHYYV